MNDPHLDRPREVEHGTLFAYLLGFILSLVLTGAAYLLVTSHLWTGDRLMVTLGLLALTQAVVQLLLFLHLGSEPKPHWNGMVLLFMASVLAIIVGGSLWIMYNLNDRLMTGM